MSASRQSRDSEDYQKLICVFQDHNPLSTETKDLQNIVSGVVAHESFNVEEVKQVSSYVFKSSTQVVNLSEKLKLKG